MNWIHSYPVWKRLLVQVQAVGPIPSKRKANISWIKTWASTTYFQSGDVPSEEAEANTNPTNSGPSTSDNQVNK